MSDEETEEAKVYRRRQEDFYDWVEGKDSNYEDKKEEMRSGVDNNEYYLDHFSRNETDKEYEQRQLRELRGKDY